MKIVSGVLGSQKAKNNFVGRGYRFFSTCPWTAGPQRSDDSRNVHHVEYTYCCCISSYNGMKDLQKRNFLLDCQDLERK